MKAWSMSVRVRLSAVLVINDSEIG
jgi:hypothetical protein